MKMSKVESKSRINGILLLNKATGLTSNAVLQKTKRLFNAQKAGHTGSLDPLATGMLPICFGEATKFSQYLLDADKTYEATGVLGIKTNTADALGEVIAEKLDSHPSITALTDVLQSFEGQQLQIPSMFSALKHQGRPLYALARKGIEVERKAREIDIKEIKLINFDGKQFRIRVSCSKGTYIRNLVEDIGERLGTYAHVGQLHRSHTAGFSEDRMVSLEELEAMDEASRPQWLLPMERAILHFPIIRINEEQRLLLQQGRTVDFQRPKDLSSCVRLYGPNEDFIGLGEFAEEGVLQVKRLLAIVEKL